MRSYWGVEHGDAVSKSYIPGKGWVPAVKAGKDALRGAKGGHQKAKGVSWEDRLFQTNQKNTKTMLSELGKPKKITSGGVKMNHYRSNDMPPGLGAFAVMTGKNKRHMVSPPGSPKWINTHEKAHLSPKKRTSYRLNQIVSNPRKAMREEARADVAGGQLYRKPMTNPLGNSGYRQAARSSTGARELNSQHRQIRQMTAASLSGSDRKLFSAMPKRDAMFAKRPVADYRKTQDKITGASGSARTQKPISRKNRLEARAWDNTNSVSQGRGRPTGVPQNPRRAYMADPWRKPTFTRPDEYHRGVPPQPPKRGLLNRFKRSNG